MLPLISVIIPVYNVEKYLDKCIQSVVDQTYSNIEILIVDDGSSDRSPLICDEFAKKDKRIKVMHKANGGQSSARNLALNIASGEYLAFVDSDDYIEPDMLEFLFQNMGCSQADISICELKKVVCGIVEENHEEDTILMLNKEDAFYELIKDGKVTSHPCNKLFKRKLFVGIRFPEGRVYEDIAIMHEVFFKAEKVVYSPEQKYFYVIRNNSTSYNQTPQWAYGLYRAFFDRAEFIKKQMPSIYEQALSGAVNAAIGALIHFAKFKKEITAIYEEEICSFLKENHDCIFSSANINKKRKVIAFFILKYYRIFRAIYNIYFTLKFRKEPQ